MAEKMTLNELAKIIQKHRSRKMFSAEEVLKIASESYNLGFDKACDKVTGIIKEGPREWLKK